MATTNGVRNAISRALALGGAVAVTRVRYGRYRVASSSRPGRFHTVTVDAGGRYRSDCEAGRVERVCWHQAATYIAKLERGAGVRVVGPAAGAPPAAPERIVAFRPRRAA